jgi:hypothetical protein
MYKQGGTIIGSAGRENIRDAGVEPMLKAVGNGGVFVKKVKFRKQ